MHGSISESKSNVLTNWLELKILVEKGNPSLQVTIGSGHFTDIVGNDDVIFGSLRIYAMFINPIPLVPKKILNMFPGPFFRVSYIKRY